MPLPRPWLPTDLFREIDAADFENQTSNDLWSFSFGHQADRDIANLAKSAQLPEAPIVVSDRPDARTMPAVGQPAAMPQASSAPVTTLTPGAGSAPSSGSAPEAGPGRTPTPSPSPAPMPSASADGGDLEAWARQEAARLGIDPDTAVRVANTEGGFGDPTRQSDFIGPDGQREQSYGPYQLNVTGGLGSSALQQGIDPRNPAHARAAITYALEHAARNGWGYFHGAARAGIGDWDGIGGRPAAAPSQTSPTAGPTPQTGTAPAWGTYTPESLTPNQFTEGQEQGLTADEALAICGPAAAVAFSRANGRNPTLREAKELAQSLGVWDVSTGMHGPASQVQLLGKMGVQARLAEGTDWNAVAREVQAGRPVIVDTPMHYYVVTGFDPNTGEFEFGQSAGVLRRSGGKTRWRPEELPSLGMGAPRATIYMGAN